jgi:hypothetical protein
MQEAVAQLAGHVFDRPARVARSLTHILAADLDRQTERRGKLAAERLVAISICATQLMVEVCYGRDPDVTVALPIQEQMEERN